MDLYYLLKQHTDTPGHSGGRCICDHILDLGFMDELGKVGWYVEV